MEVLRKRRPEAVVVERIAELSGLLSDLTRETCELTEFDGTYEIETSSFTLSCTLVEGFFEIRNIDTHGHKGLGREIITAVHEFADTYHLEVIAGMVKDEARGFWEKMGYVEGEEAGDFFRVV